MLQFYILRGSFFFPRVVERLDLKNVSVLMVDFFFFSVLCCLSVAARRAGREVTARRWLWYA